MNLMKVIRITTIILLVGFGSCGTGIEDFGLPIRLSFKSLTGLEQDTIFKSFNKLENHTGVTILNVDSSDTLHVHSSDYEVGVIARASFPNGAPSIGLSQDYLTQFRKNDKFVLCDEEREIYFFHVVLWHEFGHILGLPHDENPKSLMFHKRSVFTCKNIDWDLFFLQIRNLRNERIATRELKVFH